MRERRATDIGRIASITRAEELRQDVKPYLASSKRIETGLGKHPESIKNKQKILKYLSATEQDWQSWKWQMKNRIRDAGVLGEILGLGQNEIKRIEKVGKIYRWAVSPYYLSLVSTEYQNHPIYGQAVPDVRELQAGGNPDPMAEEFTSPAPLITRRYPDRLIINVTNQCAMFCRHCQRRRNIGENDQNACTDDIKAALEYVAENPEIRDVLVTGGDALMLSDKTLDWILGELSAMPHVEMKRIGTRVPVTLPQRITPELCEVFKKYPPIYINTQFNHPLEVTPEAKEACDRLIEAGVMLGNQAVLLRGINDCPDTMRKLNQELLRIRVRPYYIFHAKNVVGTNHWQTSIRKGLDIMENLRGHTSGMAIPTYVYNAPDGLGKIPVMPNYIVEQKNNLIRLRTWEGKIVEVIEK